MDRLVTGSITQADSQVDGLMALTQWSMVSDERCTV